MSKLKVDWLRVAVTTAIVLSLTVFLTACGPAEEVDSVEAPPAPSVPDSSEPASEEVQPSTPPSDTSADADVGDAAAVDDASAIVPEPVEEVADAAAEPIEESVVAGSGEPVTADSIVGTKWDAGGIEFEFMAENKLKVNGIEGGTWQIADNKLTVEALGQSHTADIQGDSIIYRGNPLERKQ